MDKTDNLTCDCINTKEAGTNEQNTGSMDRSKYTFDLVNSWIENAENKVSISCGIFSGVFAVISFLSDRITKGDSINECWRKVYVLFFVLGLIGMGFSILFYVLAINPNLANSGKKSLHKPSEKKETGNGKKYPIFFGDIAAISEQEYEKAVRSANEFDFLEELHRETHMNSVICLKKMKMYKRGLKISCLAVAFAIISWVAHFLMVFLVK